MIYFYWFKANWYKAEQYCRFHGMHLASINSADEQRDLQEHIQAYGTYFDILFKYLWGIVDLNDHKIDFTNLNLLSFLGMGHEHFWTSGTDQGEEGKFFWMSNGKPVTFENWNAGEPNNFV